MELSRRRGAFLDRDGTIIEDLDYLDDPSRVRLLPGAAAAIKRLNEAAIPVIVVTNQSGIGRGYFSEAEYHAVADRVEAALRDEGARIDATYFCPHGPDDPDPCGCRKPRPYLFELGAREHDVDPARSCFVGDRLRDVSPGLKLGGTPYLIRGEHTPREEVIPPSVQMVSSLAEAVSLMFESWRSD